MVEERQRLLTIWKKCYLRDIVFADVTSGESYKENPQFMQ